MCSKYELLKRQAFRIVGRGVVRCNVPACPIWALDMLHLDHVENDGNLHRGKRKAAGTLTYRWVLKNPAAAQEGLQILCANHDRMKQRYKSVERIVAVEEQEGCDWEDRND